MRCAFAGTILIFALTSTSTLARTAVHHVPRTPEDQGPDIPIVGSSVFDKIFSVANGSEARYRIPYPLENLLRALPDSSEPAFVHTLFPFSRSLQRPVNLKYDPVQNPRVVLGAAKGSVARNKLFIGYVRPTDQLEVISYNDEAGRYEYQIVKGYSTSNPQVYYVQRGKCLSCHQGQAPIFSTPPWIDTSLGSTGELIAHRVGLPKEKANDAEAIFAKIFSAGGSRPNVAMLDSLIREANAIALDERVWVVGCGSNRACRLGLLLRTLATNSRELNTYWPETQRTLASSPLQQQDVYHSFISSTDLGLRDLVRSKGSMDLNDSDVLSVINNIFRMGPDDNPATPRRLNLLNADLSVPRLATFTIDDMSVLYDEGRTANELGLTLTQMYREGDPAFDEGALNKLRLMSEILGRFHSVHQSKYREWVERPTPPKILLAEPLKPVFKTAELNVFSRHCSACHASGLSFPPQFLLGTEDEVILKISQLKDRIQFKLRQRLMPPNPELRKFLEDSGDLQVLLDYLDSDSAQPKTPVGNLQN